MAQAMSNDRKALRAIAEVLGLSGQVNPDGTRVKVPHSTVVAKVVAMRDELAALKQASITPVTTVGTKREREEEEEEEDAQASTKLVKTLKTAIESGAIRPESKLEAIRAMKDVPSRFAPLCKFTVFKDRHGINLTVVGFNSTKSSFSCVCASSMRLADPNIGFDKIELIYMDPLYVCKQLGIDMRPFHFERLLQKFWSKMGGGPRQLQFDFQEGGWKVVDVIEWSHRSRKRPIVIECEATGKTFCVPVNFSRFRELS